MKQMMWVIKNIGNFVPLVPTKFLSIIIPFVVVSRQQKRRDPTQNLTFHQADVLKKKKPEEEDLLRMCKAFNWFFSNKIFYKHKQSCKGEDAKLLKVGAVVPNSIAENLITDTDVQKNILNRFRDGDAGNFTSEYRTIPAVGFRYYVTRRHAKGKIVVTRNEVMSEKRELARLYKTFHTKASSPVEFEEMFSRTHLKFFKEQCIKWLTKKIKVLKNMVLRSIGIHLVKKNNKKHKRSLFRVNGRHNAK